MRAVDLDQTHYDTLGINRKAGAADIKAAYRRLTKTHHPDLGGDARVFAAINVAYGVLRDERSGYDLDLAAAERATTTPGPAPVIPDDWQPEAWVEDEVDADAWLEVEVVEPPARPAAYPDPVPVPRPAPSHRPPPPPVNRFLGSESRRTAIAILLLAVSFAVSLYLAMPARVLWVAWASFVVGVLATLRSRGRGWFTLVVELIASALLIWGAYADEAVIGALAAIGIVVPLVVAGELFAMTSRSTD